MKNSKRNFAMAILSSLIALGAFSGAQATSHGNDWLFDKPYGKAGKWTISHGKTVGDTCVAEQDNANFTLRILHTDYTGDWYIGVPNYQDKNFAGGMSVNFGATASQNNWSDAVDFNTSHVNGWAMVFFQQRVRNDLKRAASVELDAGQGRQVWSLAGSSKAIAMLQECAQNQGKRPKRQIVVQRKPRKNTAQNTPLTSANVNAQSCPDFNQYRAKNSNRAAKVEFFNYTGNPNGALKVYWIDFNGKLVDIAIFDNDRAVIDTYVGHSFIVRDRDGNCYSRVYTMRSGNNSFTLK